MINQIILLFWCYCENFSMISFDTLLPLCSIVLLSDNNVDKGRNENEDYKIKSYFFCHFLKTEQHCKLPFGFCSG